ncbi:MAG: type II toxin-antitoxin system RatA family toxin [Armatimonadota bacterium]
MRTIDEIDIHAGPDSVFQTAADVLSWPRVLPHYRWVKLLGRGDDQLCVEMAAWRGCIPLRWRSVLRSDAAQRRIYFTHTGGPSRGMEVTWAIEPTADGAHVRIVHEMTLNVPLIRTTFGKWIVGRFFVHPVAARTLLKMKEAIEKKETLCDVP